MGGPNLEIFKFTLYLFVPLAALIHFGNPEWYRTKVVPVGIFVDSVSVFVFTFFSIEINYFMPTAETWYFPSPSNIYISFSSFDQWLPKDQSGVREELARIKAERLLKQARREAEAEKNSKS